LALKTILDYLNKIEATNLNDVLAGNFDQLPDSIRSSMDALGLLNLEKTGVNISGLGGTNHGVLVGDNTLLLRKGSKTRYEEAQQLKEALDEAADSGVNVARILDVVFDAESQSILEL
jgi:hypothetical protein